jgi:hypothetical protein
MMTFRDIHILLAKVRYKDWSFRVSLDGGGVWVLQAIIPAHDSKTGESTTWTGRKWRLSAFMTPSEVVQTAFKAVLTAEEHEAREAFLYQGRSIFGPHYNVDALWAIATEEHEDTRPPAQR